MTIQSVRQYVVAEDDGGTWFATWRKSPTQTTVAGIWYDLGMATGNPAPNYYAATPLRSKALARSTDGGLDHGGSVSPSKKYLKEFCIIGSAGVPITFLLCDYLLYYPFVDMDNTDVVTVEPLSRYADGFGVQIMAIQVFSQSGVGSPKFQVQYTNSDGTAGRLTELVSCNTLTIPGNVITTHAVQPAGYCHSASPFIPLQRGDRGVRSIQSVIWQTPDVGLVALVLCKPLAVMPVTTVGVACERDFLNQIPSLPRIYDGAALHWLLYAGAAVQTGTSYFGHCDFVWG